MSWIRWAAALAATIALIGLDLLGASRSGSQALWADVIHVSLDGLAIALAGLTFIRPGKRTATMILAIQAALMLLLGGLYALRVLGFLPIHQHFRDPDLAFRVALLGLLANLGAAWMLRGQDSLKGALYHALGDAMGSVFATAALFLVKLTGDTSWDTTGALLMCATMWLIGSFMATQVARSLVGKQSPPGPEHDRSAIGSLALAAFLIVATLLVGATAASTPPPTWRFLYPDVEIAHGDLDGAGPWTFPQEVPAGAVAATIRIHLVSRPTLLTSDPSFEVTILDGTEELASAVWHPAGEPWMLETPRWTRVPIEAVGDWNEIQADLPDLPARTLRFEVQPLVGSNAPQLDQGWDLEWRLSIETIQPFEVNPLQPAPCPAPPLVTLPC